MPKYLNRFTVPSLVTVALASFALAACGGDSEDSASSSLAKYMPADALVYVEGAVRPDQEVADDVESLSTKLTGTSLSDTIDDALNSSSDSDITYDADVEPWLGENAAMYVETDVAGQAASFDDTSGSMDDSAENVGLVAETTDVEASEGFISKVAAEDGATDGEYEGFSYKVSNDDDSAIGIVDDYVVFASSPAVFEAMVDASKGDSLEDTKAFSEVIGNAPDGSLVDMYVNNEPLVSASSEGAGAEAGVDVNSIYSAVGIDYTDTGTLVSLVPTENEISLVGSSNIEAPFESGDPSAVIETFPANSLFATGSGDVGANITKVIDDIDEQGIEGLLEPGELKKNLDQASSQGLDALKIIESLETVGFFVSGDSVQNLGGALVATTSDPEPLKNALGAFSSLISLADDASVRPLGGGIAGFKARTSELPGRPVVVAVQGDRLVLAIGMPAARQALSGEGESLADSAAYQAASDSLSGENVDMFGNPAAIGSLLAEALGETGAEAGEYMNKFEYMVGGSGSEDGSFEFNLGLKD
ncbi:MAG: DUF3352 domain-containing protein [Actinomycetota bacterium]|nr:DUF3352 domain-containing protein [Actinomycetota bacterium]